MEEKKQEFLLIKRELEKKERYLESLEEEKKEEKKEEEGNWYHFRPQETLKELMKLIDKTRKDLEKYFQGKFDSPLAMKKNIVLL